MENIYFQFRVPVEALRGRAYVILIKWWGSGLGKLLAAGAARNGAASHQPACRSSQPCRAGELTMTAADTMNSLTSLARSSFIERGSMLGSHGWPVCDVDTCASEIVVAWRQRRLARPMRPIVCSEQFSTLKGACSCLTSIQVCAPTKIDAGTMSGTSQHSAPRWLSACLLY